MHIGGSFPNDERTDFGWGETVDRLAVDSLDLIPNPNRLVRHGGVTWAHGDQ